MKKVDFEKITRDSISQIGLKTCEGALILCLAGIMGCSGANTSATEGAEASAENQAVAGENADAEDNTSGQSETDSAQNDIDSSKEENSTDESIEEQANGEDGALTDEVTESDDTSEPQESSASGEKSMELYELFLKNEATVLINTENDFGEYWNLDSLKNMDVTLEALSKSIIDYFTADNPSSRLRFEGIDYAYIDCGNDGDPELLLRFNTPDSGDSWQEYIVIKAVDGILETVYSNIAWGRSRLYFNEYGYIFSDGSAGATEHIFDKSFIDSAGKLHFIYSDYSTSGIMAGNIGSVIAVNGEVYSVPNEILTDDEYVFFSFDFFNTPESYFDDIYTYAKVEPDPDPDYEHGYRGYFYAPLADDDSIYEEGNPYRKFFESTGAPLYSLKEMDSKVADKEAKEGLTEEVKNGADADFKPLEYDFAADIPTYNDNNILKIKEYFPIAFLTHDTDDNTAYLRINADGTIEGDYSDWNYNEADGSSVTNKNEFTGAFTVSEKIDDTTYDLELSDYSLKYEVGTSETAEYIKGSASVTNYVDVWGFDDNCTKFRLYTPGTDISKIDKAIVSKLPDNFRESDIENDCLKEYLLYGLEGKNYIWTGFN